MRKSGTALATTLAREYLTLIAQPPKSRATSRFPFSICPGEGIWAGSHCHAAIRPAFFKAQIVRSSLGIVSRRGGAERLHPHLAAPIERDIFRAQGVGRHIDSRGHLMPSLDACPWKGVKGTLPIDRYGALQWARLLRGKQWGTEMYIASRELRIDDLATQQIRPEFICLVQHKLRIYWGQRPGGSGQRQVASGRG